MYSADPKEENSVALNTCWYRTDSFENALNGEYEFVLPSVEASLEGATNTVAFTSVVKVANNSIKSSAA